MIHANIVVANIVKLPVARTDTPIMIRITIVASVSPISGRGEVLGAEQQ